MAKSIIRLDHKFNKLVTVKYYNGSNYNDAIENGRVLKLNGLITGEREVFQAIAPAAAGDDLVITAGVELNYDESSLVKRNLNEYENAAGKAFRCIIPEFGKIYSVSLDAVSVINDADDVPAVNNLLIYDASGSTKTKLLEVASNTDVSTYKFVGQVIGKETVAGTTMIVIRIIKA